MVDNWCRSPKELSGNYTVHVQDLEKLFSANQLLHSRLSYITDLLKCRHLTNLDFLIWQLLVNSVKIAKLKSCQFRLMHAPTCVHTCICTYMYIHVYV